MPLIRVLLLLPLEHGEIDDPHGLASDATEWKLLFYARYEGGVLLRIQDDQDIDHAMPIIRKAYSVANTSTPQSSA